MFTLLYSPGACSLAPHIALEWIGTGYEARRVKLGSQELLAVNPAGSVPVLIEEDGWILTQAGAILHYLARKFPAAGLGGEQDLRSQAELDRWSSFFTGDLHPSFYPQFTPDRYTTDRSESALQAVREAGQELARKRFELLNDHLADRPYMLGRQRSLVDAYAFPMLRWGLAKLPEKFANYPHVQSLHDRIADDQSVQKVLRDEAQT